MRLPKTISVISIMLIVLLPCMYCAYFQARQSMVRYEMEEKLERENLQTVVVPVKDFRWYEENREIIVDGMMFDVKSMHRQGENYVITGLFDEHETELHIAMGRLQRKQGDEQDAQLISYVINQPLMPFGDAGSLQSPPFDELELIRILHSEKLHNTILSIHTPPPRC